MQPFGSDRVRPGESEEQQILLSRLSKGWTPRASRTSTSAEFPGTAVLWDGRYFQVVDATSMPHGGVQYILEPWPDTHAIRVSDRYDAESEAVRIAEWRAQLVRENRRKSAGILAVLTGHLPEAIQEHLGRELGVSPPRMTMASAFGTYLIVAGLVYWIGEGIINQTPRPFWMIVTAIWLGLESSIRFFSAWITGTSMGSPIGTMGYIAWYVVAGKRGGARSPFAQERGRSIKTSVATPEQSELDAFTMREPWATLLPRADQERIAVRFPYDYRRNASIVAGIILVSSLLGIVSSIHTGARMPLLVAIALSIEQIWRLITFRSHPAGSVLGFVVRPFLHKLLT